MRRSILFLVLATISSIYVSAQEYITHGATPDLHLVHKVLARETWSALGRQYNLSAKDISAYNKQSADKPLEVGQSVKIPLTSANFSQNDSKAGGEVLVPVYHVVGEKEWMYRISVNHNKVPIEKLEKWNSIKSDQAKAGMKLIVGFLTVKKANAALATRNTAADKNTAPATEQQRQEPAKTNRGTVSLPKNTANKEGGFFSDQYDETGKTLSGVSGIFKSTSGWNDGKYYALMNNITVGTIVKIHFPKTNKTVYAKILGELPDMKESAGLGLRISDAAAGALGAVESKFSVDVNY